jgi:hypothetical protein
MDYFWHFSWTLNSLQKQKQQTHTSLIMAFGLSKGDQAKGGVREEFFHSKKIKSAIKYDII